VTTRLAALLVTLFIIVAGSAMGRTSTTFDEIVFPAVGARALANGDFGMVNDHPRLPQLLLGMPLHLAGVKLPPEVGHHWNWYTRYQYSEYLYWMAGNAGERVTLKLPRQIVLAAKGVNGSFITGDIDGAVEVTGINGRVQVGNAVGTATFKGINGNMVVGLKRIDQEGVTLSGINGNIELQLGADVNADFDARGMNGQVISDLPGVQIDKEKRGKYWARIGTGGSGITAKGINGNIRFTRSAVETAAVGQD